MCRGSPKHDEMVSLIGVAVAGTHDCKDAIFGQTETSDDAACPATGEAGVGDDVSRRRLANNKATELLQQRGHDGRITYHQAWEVMSECC